MVGNMTKKTTKQENKIVTQLINNKSNPIYLVELKTTALFGALYLAKNSYIHVRCTKMLKILFHRLLFCPALPARLLATEQTESRQK